MKYYFSVLSFFILISCVNTRHQVFPKYIGHDRWEKLLITRLGGASGKKAENLVKTAIKRFQPCLGFSAINDEEVYFILKKNGLNMPKYDKYDTADFQHIYQLTGIDYILVSKVAGAYDQVSGSDEGDKNTRKAVIVSKILDLKGHRISLEMTTTTTVSPLQMGSDDDAEYYNISESSYAVGVAYKKMLKKLFQAFQCKKS